MNTRWIGVIAVISLALIISIGIFAQTHGHSGETSPLMTEGKQDSGKIGANTISLLSLPQHESSPLSVSVTSVWIDPANPEYDEDITVYAKVENASYVQLNYTYTGINHWLTVNMSLVKPVENTYAYNISSFPYGTVVYFKVKAVNGSESVETSIYYFTVGDQTPPSISNVTLSVNSTWSLKNTTLRFTVSEPVNASGVYTVWVDVYRNSSSGWSLYDTVDLGALNGNGTVYYIFTEGGTYRFAINAVDNAGNHAVKYSENVTVLRRPVVLIGLPDNITVEYGDPLSLSITLKDNVSGKPLGNVIVDVYVRGDDGEYLFGSGITDSSGYVIISAQNTYNLDVGNYTLVVRADVGGAFEKVDVEIKLRVVPEKLVFKYTGSPIQEDTVDAVFTVSENDGGTPVEMGMIKVYNSSSNVYVTVYGTSTFHFTLKAYMFNVTRDGILIGFSFIAKNYDSSIVWVLVPHRLPVFAAELPSTVEQGETVNISVHAFDPDGVQSLELVFQGKTYLQWSGLPIENASLTGELTVPIGASAGPGKWVVVVKDSGGHIVKKSFTVNVRETKIIMKVSEWVDNSILHVVVEAHYSSGYNASIIKVYVYLGSDYIVAKYNGTHFTAERVIVSTVALRVIAFDDYGHEAEYSTTVEYSLVNGSSGGLFGGSAFWLVAIGSVAVAGVIGFVLKRRAKGKLFEKISVKNRDLGNVLSEIEEEEL